MTLESALLGVGRELAKQIAHIWIAPSSARRERESSLSELIAIGVPDQIRRRKLARQIEEIGDKVAERLIPLCGHEFATLSVDDKNAVIDTATTLLASADLSDSALLGENFNSHQIAQKLLTGSAKQVRSATLGSDGEALLELVVREACVVLCTAIEQLPAFTPRALTEVLQRSSRISDDISNILDRIPRATLVSQRGTAFDGEFQARYNEHVSATHDRLELFGLDTRSYRLQTAVTTAFLSLNVSIEAVSLGRTTDNGELVGRGVSVESKVETALSLNNRLLIRGDAGCGKTTLLQWLAVSASRGTFTGPLVEWNGITPFLIRLRSLLGTGLPRPEQFVELAAPPISGFMPEGWVHRQLDTGRALLLIDGVDEVHSTERPKVKRWLRDLLLAYPSIRVVVTSRPAAATDSWLTTEGFQSASVEPMSTRDVRTFCVRWHDAVRDAAQTNNVMLPCRIDELHLYEVSVLRHIEARRSLQALATNPLMCAMLCALNLDRRRNLPPDRMRIYAEAIQLLVDRRDADRDIPSATEVSLGVSQKLAIIQYLAWRISEAGRAELPRAEAIEHVKKAMAQLPGADLDGDAVLTFLVNRSGIIREPTPQRIDFIHRTFQEYLAAKECVDSHAITTLVARAHLDQWRETLIMAAGHVTGPHIDALLLGILDRADREPRHSRRLRLLAAACLETVTVLPPTIAERIDDALGSIAPPRSRRESRSVALAGRRALRHFPTSTTGLSAPVAAACITAASLIGGEEALALLTNYAMDPRNEIQQAIQFAWEYFDSAEFAEKVLADAPLSSWYTGSRHEQGGHIIVLRRNQANQLQKLRNLQAVQVSIHGREPEDLTDLADVPMIHSLFMSPSSPVDISPLQVHNDLHYLSVLQAGVRAGFEILPTFPNLGRLSLSLKNVPATEDALDHILSVSGLHDLELHGARLVGGISKLEPVLAQLRFLGLHDCSDVASVEDLKATRLHWIRIARCPVSDLAPLIEIQSLRTLWLEGEPASDLSALRDHPTLAFLIMYGNDEIDLTPFADWTQNRRLTVRVDRSNRSNVQGLASLPPQVKVKFT